MILCPACPRRDHLSCSGLRPVVNAHHTLCEIQSDAAANAAAMIETLKASQASAKSLTNATTAQTAKLTGLHENTEKASADVDNLIENTSKQFGVDVVDNSKADGASE